MKKIPITLITGFLGAGKSTFVNRILKERPDIKFGLILNEFGDVKLESQIVEAKEDEIVELENGCMCCVGRSDIVDSVVNILRAQPQLDHIIIEASGLSDPVPIAQTLMTMPRSTEFDLKVNLETIICIVDALNFSFAEQDFIITTKQLEFASFIVFTKTKEAGIEQTEKVRAQIQALAGRVSFHDYEALDLDDLLDCSTVDHSDIAALEIEHGHHGKDTKHKHHHVHEHVTKLFYKSKKPLDYKKFLDFLQSFPQEIIRAKGIVHFPGKHSELKVVVQCVGSRRDGILQNWKEGEEKQNAIVFLGKEFDKQAVEDALKACEEQS